jgi:hypothetical protein
MRGQQNNKYIEMHGQQNVNIWVYFIPYL